MIQLVPFRGAVSLAFLTSVNKIEPLPEKCKMLITLLKRANRECQILQMFLQSNYACIIQGE